MNHDQVNIDQLFDQARSIETQVSYEQTKKAFLTSLMIGAGGVLATKGVLKLLTTKKWLIMMSAITTVTTASVVGVMSMNTDVEKTGITTNPGENPQLTTKELVLESPEEKEQETLVYAENFQEEKEDLIEVVESEDFTNIGDFTIYQELFNDDTIKVNADGNFEKEEIKPYSQRFVISSKTTMEDLEAMKIEAEKAGIQFNYKARIKKNQLKSIALHTKIKRHNNHQSMSITSDDFDGDDEPMVFGWYSDKNGKATEMGFGDESNIKCSTGKSTYNGTGENHEHHVHHDDYEYAYAYNYDLFENCDSLKIELSDNMEDLLETLEEELEILESQIENRKETIDLSGVKVILQEVNAESKELFDAIHAELNVLFQEIEEKGREKKVDQ